MCRYTCSLLSFFPRLSSLLSFPPDGSYPFSHPREEEEKEEDEEEEDEKEESFRKTINRILWSQLRNIAENSTYFSLKSSLRLVLPHFSSRRKKREEWENRESWVHEIKFTIFLNILPRRGGDMQSIFHGLSRPVVF